MNFEDIKRALQPTIDDDLDELYKAYLSDEPGGDMLGFVDLLIQAGLVPEPVVASLVQSIKAGTLSATGYIETVTSAKIPVKKRKKAISESAATPRPAEARSKTRSSAEITASGDRRRRRGTGTSPSPRRRSSGSSGTSRRRATGARRKPGRGTNGEAAAQPVRAKDVKAGQGYDFLGKLGEGAMGAVLKARDIDLNRLVAYKSMSAEIAKTPLADKFIGEAQITAQLQHPNIIPIYALDHTKEGNLAYSMKMIKGRTFEDLIKEARAFVDQKQPVDKEHSLANLLELFLPVCDAMYYAHQRGVVHRDLKPENIMVGPYNEVYVMDWGIARLMKSPPTTSTGIVELVEDQASDGEMVIGTPQYMSPEQANALNDELDGASDQYALGLILFELAALIPAVTGKSPIKIVMRQQDAEKDAFVHYGGEPIPPEIKAITHKATAAAIGDRYASVQALGDDIRAYLRGEETQALPDNAVRKFYRTIQRHRELTLFMLLLVFALGATTVIGTLAYSYVASAQAHAREERVGEIISKVGAQAALIDGTFVRYEGLLGVLAATSSDMLTSGRPSERPVHWETDFASVIKTAVSPSDVHISKVYDRVVSFEDPVFTLSAGISKAVVRRSVARLEPMRRHYKKILLRSKSEAAATKSSAMNRRLLSDRGVPVVWTHIGLENGLYSGYPGHGGFPKNFDVHKRPWYKLGKRSSTPTWGAPYPDPLNMGRILPCAISLFDHSGKVIGVAAIELTFDYIISDLMEIPGLFESDNELLTEEFLVDAKGRIVVQSSKKDVKVKGNWRSRELRLKEFPVPEVREKIAAYESGITKFEGKTIVYQQMNSLGWYYILMGDTSVMMDKLSR